MYMQFYFQFLTSYFGNVTKFRQGAYCKFLFSPCAVQDKICEISVQNIYAVLTNCGKVENLLDKIKLAYCNRHSKIKN